MRPLSATVPRTMRAWQLDSYKGIEALKFKEDVRTPKLMRPNEVLVKVERN